MPGAAPAPLTAFEHLTIGWFGVVSEAEVAALENHRVYAHLEADE